MRHIMLPSLPGDVTHLPVTHCQICDRTLAYRPGNISEVLTAHTAGSILKHSTFPPG